MATDSQSLSVLNCRQIKKFQNKIQRWRRGISQTTVKRYTEVEWGLSQAVVKRYSSTIVIFNINENYDYVVDIKRKKYLPVLAEKLIEAKFPIYCNPEINSLGRCFLLVSHT